MDMGKLTPAPWTVEVHDRTDGGCELRERTVGPLFVRSNFPPGTPEGDQADADMAFIALARNALDVMMRRGWVPVRTPTGKWTFGNEVAPLVVGDSFKAAEDYLKSFPQDDPFTALVEADRWYRGHVEAKAVS